MRTKGKRKKIDRKSKTNWKIYDIAMKNEYEWFVQNAKEIIDKMPEPWETSEIGATPL